MWIFRWPAVQLESRGETVKTGTETRGSSILVVDDDASLASALKEFLAHEGYFVEVALSAAEALSIQAANPRISLALVDLIMPVTDGLTLTDELRRRDPDLSVVIMTGYGTIETAVDAIKRGAEDYVTKPFDYEAVRKKIARLTEVIELRERVAQLEKNLERHPCFENIVSLSPAMERVLEHARLAAGSDAPVLLLGETGTGKEMLARAIHAASPRAQACLLWRSTAAPCRANWPRASCSVSARALSQALTPMRRGSSRRHPAAPYSWMRSAKCRRISR